MRIRMTAIMVKRFFYIMIALSCGLFLVILRSTANMSGRQHKTRDDDAARLHTSTGFFREDSSKMKSPSERSQERIQNMRKACKEYGLQNYALSAIEPKMFHHILVDDTYKALYCQIPKVACTNWRRVFLIMTGKMNTSDPMKLDADSVHHRLDKHLTYLKDFSPSEIRKRLKHYFKFIIVREPSERILSAFRNKFHSLYGAYFQTTYGRKIIKKYRENPTFEALRDGKDVTFPEFVQYLVDPISEKRKILNEHWIQYYKLCHPCLVQYDFIGKYETLDEDANHILEAMGVQSFIKFPTRSLSYSHSETKPLLHDYYKNIPQQHMEELSKMFYPDYKLFSFRYPDFFSNKTFNSTFLS